MSLKISDDLFAKANRFPESSYGATTVTLVLVDGRRIDNVVLGGASDIVKVAGRAVSDEGELDFAVADIANVYPSSRLGALRAQLASFSRRFLGAKER